MTVVELDERGRALLPSYMRKKLKARRFEAKLVEGRIELIPVEGMKTLKGKYKNRVRTSWPKLEEKAERFVRGQGLKDYRQRY